MKKLILSIATLTMLGGIAKAQNMIYDPTYNTNATYTPLSANATVVPFQQGWDDDLSAPITLPFTFKYQNTDITNVMIDTYGALVLNGNIVSQDMGPQIMGLQMDYADNINGSSVIHYETDGTAGDRIFKLEFQNVGTYNNHTSNDTVNFQIWLYERDHSIEYRTGHCNIPDSFFSNSIQDISEGGKEALLIGLNYNEGNEINYNAATLFLHSTRWVNNTFSDTLQAFDNQNFSPTLPQIEAIFSTGFPPNGSVIRYTPNGRTNTTSVNTVTIDQINVYPNPSANGIFNISIKNVSNDAQIALYDLTGKQILKLDTVTEHNKIDLSNAPTGNYIVKVTIGQQTLQYKLVKE